MAANSNSALPTFYRVVSACGVRTKVRWCCGSWILALWTLAVALLSGRLPVTFAARVLGVLGVVSLGFHLFTLVTSNPFERLLPPAFDGRDLNPVLQDPALAVHPPLLYTGYVGFAVAFAFACAAMLEGKLDQTWARWTRPWTTAAWAFLTIGIALGSWWAYYELGWGGYWFWDPVENASFMPWLVGTALIHSLAVTDKRGLFKSWTLLLAILAFSMSLLGTFLVRSGVLVSVHSFAADPSRGMFILAFLVIMIGGALSLYAWRAPLLRSQAGFELTARESFLLFNNILLIIAATVVFGGTLAPLISDALGLGTLSVGTQYFNPDLPPASPAAAGARIGGHSFELEARPYWREEARARTEFRARTGPRAGARLWGLRQWQMADADRCSTLGIWIILSSLIDPIDRWRRKMSLSRSIVGMTVAHIALGVFVLSLTVVESYTIERDAALQPGESLQLGRYAYRFDGIKPVEGPNYDGVRGEVTVFRDGKEVGQLFPEKRNYWVQGQVMTEADIDTRWNKNVFAALGEDLGAGSWSIRAQIRPLIDYVWLAAFLMAIGGAIAASDRRYRLATRTEEDTASAGPAIEGAAS